MINLLDELHSDFIEYATEVNNNRAFPDARDGLKPSQRACLWEMYHEGYSSTKPHVKSAKVDGGVIAHWWPHGSEYNTFVRMSQPWNNNICEVNFHGANGSQLGGPDPAAPRYTECRLSEASEEGFFNNIKKKVVEFQPNFSEDMEWPTVLPSLFPRLFVNGSQGIGYTIAQEWEPGNLLEFVDQVKRFIKSGKVDCTKIYPDYPTGGIIINGNDVHTIYETGKGTVILRAKTEIVDNVIKITELPYQVYAEPLIQKVKNLVNDNTITGIEDIYNKSDDNGLLVEIECSDGCADVVLKNLFKYTDLQCTFNANQMALVNGIPTLLTLKDYVKVYINHNLSCIQREYQFDMIKARAELEVVEGLVKASSILDDVISTIRSADSSADAEKKLFIKFKFTDVQAKAIVGMRLGSLAKTDLAELSDKKASLEYEVNKCTVILNSTEAQLAELLTRLDQFKKKFGYNRKTAIDNIDLSAEREVVKEHKKREASQYVVVLTSDNQLHRIKLTDYKENRRDDTVLSSAKVTAKDKVSIINTDGLLYRISVKEIPLGTLKSKGLSLSSFGSVLAMFSALDSQPYVFIVDSSGRVKKMLLQELQSIKKKSGTVVMKMPEDTTVIRVLTGEDHSDVTLNLGGQKLKLKSDNFTTRGKSAGGVVYKPLRSLLTKTTML